MVKKRRVFIAMFLALAVMLQYSFMPQTFMSYAGETTDTNTTEEASPAPEPAPAPAAKAASTAAPTTSSSGSTTSSSTASSTTAAPAASAAPAAAAEPAAPSADSTQSAGTAQATPAESGTKDSTGGVNADGTADGNGDASGTGDEQSEISGSKTADPTELGEDRRTEVTLSLPSVEYQNEIDLVFVMDKSTSTTNGNIDFAKQVNSLINGILEMNSNLAINIGITKFRGKAEDAIAKVTDGKQSGLIRYSEAVRDIIKNALNVNPSGNGSNIHSGLRMADKWLSDSSVDKNNKYVVLLTDGKSYIWNDDEDNPTSIYTQGYKHYAMYKSDTIPAGLPHVGQTTGSYDKDSYPIDSNTVFWFDDYEDLYNSENEELTSASKYDQLCRYAIDGSQPTGIISEITATNGKTLFSRYPDYQKYWEFTPSEEWKDLVWLEANPYEIIKNDDGSITFDTAKLNPDFYQSHPDALQKGLYKAGHLWTEMNEKYNCGSVIYTGWGGGGGLSIAQSFCSWLADNSDFSAKIKSKTESGSEVVQMFSDISNDIIYLIGSGQVEDKITSDFDLDDAIKSNAFKLKVGDDVIDLSSNEGDSWYFGTATNGKYPYVVHYDSANKIITWDINVPVENAKRAALTYGLILKEGSPEGYYDTNEYAKLNYTSSDGKKTGTFTFQKPQVHYTVKTNPDPTPTPTPAPTPADNPGTDPTPGGNGGGPAGGGIITAAAGGTGTAVITANPTPKAPATTIDDPKPPLTANAYWALINLLCAIATALLSIIMIIRYFGRTKEEDEQVGDEVDVQRKGKLRIASIIPAIGAIIAFILTEDMTLPMEMVDKWTVMMVVILAIQVLVAIFANVRREEDDTEEAAA